MNTRQWIPLSGLAVTIVAALYMVALLGAQAKPELSANFTTAATAEVRSELGQTVLRGQFAVNDEDDDDVERKAILAATDIEPGASGEAEVEFPKTTVVTQEVEFSVAGLKPAAKYILVIDGRDVTTVTTDKRGRAEVELEVAMPTRK